jgi:hypothetical protein
MQSIDSLRELNSKLLAEIAELRKENAEIPELREKLLKFEAENTEIPDLRRKFAEIESEKVELKARIAELLRQSVEENKRRDAENAELKTRIIELEKNRAVTTKLECEFRDGITKVEQRQMQNDNDTKAINFSSNSSSNFNSIPEGLPEPAVNIPVMINVIRHPWKIRKRMLALLSCSSNIRRALVKR